MYPNVPLVLGSCLGLVGTIGHLLGGAHIPQKVQAIAIEGAPDLTKLDVAYVLIAWNSVGVFMFALSITQLYLAFARPTTPYSSTPTLSELAPRNRRTVLRIFASAWFLNGMFQLSGVGPGEASPWACMTMAALVGWGSILA